jgi:RNA polymerase sigma-70 factor (ECF subfamily)
MNDGDSALPVTAPVESLPSDDGGYDQLRRDLVRAVGNVCPRWLADRREDLVQIAMMKVMAVARREGNQPLATSYLYRVAHSAVVDEIRSRSRRPEAQLEEEQVAAQPTYEPNPDDAARGREIGRGIRGCLAAMKEERRLAVTLHLMGHNVPEASRLLGWPLKRVENLVYRGLADLRACLEEKGLAP